MDDSTSPLVRHGSHRDLEAAIRNREKQARRTSIMLVCVVVTLIGLILCKPLGLPRESKVLQTFYTHRQTFQELRDRMRTEQAVLLVGDEWVDTNQRHYLDPGDPDFPVAAYAQYHALLQQAHALVMYRSIADPHFKVDFVLAIRGFAGTGYTLEFAGVMICPGQWLRTSNPIADL